MKIFIRISLLLILFWSCNTNKEYYEIQGQIEIANGTTIYRIAADENKQPITIDSVTVKDGSFMIKGPIEEPDINFIQIQGQPGNFPIILEGGKIQVTIYKDSLSSSIAKGTISNDDFMKYKDETKAYIKSINSIGNEMQQALILKDSILLLDLQSEYDGIRQQIQDYEMNFIKNNTNSYVSVLILERFVSSNSLVRDSLEQLYRNLSERIKNTTSGRVIKSILNQPPSPPKVGEYAPPFAAPTPEGNLLELKNNLGQATLLEFWASWCRPCRIENPNLVALHKKMSAKGFKIIGISLDKNKSSWLQAIEDDGLTWDHVSHLKYWEDPIAKEYHVKQLPASLLLDNEGRIVATNLNTNELEIELNNLLN